MLQCFQVGVDVASIELCLRLCRLLTVIQCVICRPVQKLWEMSLQTHEWLILSGHGGLCGWINFTGFLGEFLVGKMWVD